MVHGSSLRPFMRFLLADHARGPLVVPEAEIDGVPHLAGARPFRKFNLGNQRGLTQVVAASSFTLPAKGDLESLA